MELEAKTEALTDKDSIISEMGNQLTKARECLLSNQKVGTVQLSACVVL